MAAAVITNAAGIIPVKGIDVNKPDKTLPGRGADAMCIGFQSQGQRMGLLQRRQTICGESVSKNNGMRKGLESPFFD